MDAIIKKITVKNIIPETSTAKTFVVEFSEDVQPAWKPGQFITLVFFTEHGEKRRSYSISALPGEALSFTVKKVDNGEFSRYLLEHVSTGDTLYTSGISGFFLLPELISDTQQFFFLAAGSGITPCYPMIRTLLKNSNVKIVLIYSTKNEEDCIFYEQLQSLQEVFGNRFRICFLFSNILDVYRSRLSNWLLLQLLDRLLTVPPKDALFYLCGPFEYMRMIKITLAGIIPPGNIFKENFTSFPRLIVPQPPDTNAHTVHIHIHQQRYSIRVQFPKSIIASAKENNIELPYSCEAGRCGSCVATCVSGKVWMAYNEVLTDEEIARGRVLTCQAFPVYGDVEINFE
ncbi:MAG: iron-sulfur cluster-binding domain-containing protein [Bacteroidetes bacterium]|nr:iron-sulfur cluster-binding domain-containing protein [Bacteroidota bacterium]